MRLPAPAPSSSASTDLAKRSGVSCGRGRDGRVSVALSCGATLSLGKWFFLLAALLASATYVLAPLAGVDGLRRRVVGLEQRLARKLGAMVRSRSAALPPGHAADAGAPAADGRMHLLTPPGAPSRLAAALGERATAAVFDDHYLCGAGAPPLAEVARKTIALAAISWRAPQSLRNSMASWAANGLLDIADERMIFLNSATPEDYEIAAEHGFDVYTTEEHGGNIMAGPSLAYLVGNSSADYVLLLEKDFVLSAPRAVMEREMWTGVQHLARGVDAYRLRGKSDFPAEGMPDCCAKTAPGAEPACPYHSNWRGAGTFADHQNWLLIFCDPQIMENSAGRLAMCTREPDAPTSFCYTSWESNWSNNPILFPKTWFDEKIRSIALADFERNHLFEFNTMIAWLEWSPPATICMSEQGIFVRVARGAEGGPSRKAGERNPPPPRPFRLHPHPI